MALLRHIKTLSPYLVQQLRLESQSIGIRASSSSTSSSSTSVPVKQAEPEQSKSQSSGSAQEEWTEVIDEQSGQPYYWNQKTGETTQLGEPKPKTKFNNKEWQQQATGSGPFQDGWREPPGRDLTYLYSMIGVAVGIAVGWATQYTH